MNTNNVRDLAAYVRDMDDFHMGSAPRCIIGAASRLWGTQSGYETMTDKEIQIKLGISYTQYHHLCFQIWDKDGRNVRYGEVTRDRAADALVRFANTGQIYF